LEPLAAADRDRGDVGSGQEGHQFRGGMCATGRFVSTGSSSLFRLLAHPKGGVIITAKVAPFLTATDTMNWTLRWVPWILLGILAPWLPAFADDWPQWRGPLRDGVWRETGVLERFPAEGLPVRWRTPVGPGFSGPAVAGGRVFLMDRVLDENAPADVKTQWNYRDKTRGQERVLCLDEATGKPLWSHSYPCVYQTAYGSGPRATPTVCGDREPRERWSTLFMVPHADRVFLWNDQGELILARLTPQRYQEISRVRLLGPDMPSGAGGGRQVVWSHPAYANRCVYVRNNHEVLCASLAAIPPVTTGK
jgi:outer membrane protein assembly factor BamB